MLEAAESTGGTMRGFEFHPGYRSAGLAHIVNRLDPDVAKLLKLDSRSRTAETLPTIALSPDGKHAVLRGAYGETIDGISPAEMKAFASMRKKLIFQAGILKRFLKRCPPQIGEGRNERSLAPLPARGFSLITKGRDEGRDFLRMLLMNVADVADEYLSDDRLKGLVAFDATLGIHLGPRSPTSLLGALLSPDRRNRWGNGRTTRAARRHGHACSRLRKRGSGGRCHHPHRRPCRAHHR